MCNCININIGSYKVTVATVDPFTDKIIGIDKCIYNEIRDLWKNGIQTIESCCGHNKQPGYIAIKVTVDISNLMSQLGYVKYDHPEGLEGFYKPLIEIKSIE